MSHMMVQHWFGFVEIDHVKQYIEQLSWDADRFDQVRSVKKNKYKIQMWGTWSVISLSTEKTQTNCSDNGYKNNIYGYILHSLIIQISNRISANLLPFSSQDSG